MDCLPDIVPYYGLYDGLFHKGSGAISLVPRTMVFGSGGTFKGGLLGSVGGPSLEDRLTPSLEGSKFLFLCEGASSYKNISL